MSGTDPEGDWTDDELALAIDIARRYYIENKGKSEIAAELRLSRFKVARVLQRSLDEGIVQISIASPKQSYAELANQLRARYDLNHVVIVDTKFLGPEGRLREQLGKAAAQLLERMAGPDDVVGLGWGRTITAMARSITTFPACPVVQLGGIVGTTNDNSMEPVRAVAAVSTGESYPLYAPLLMPDAASAAALKAQPGIAETVAMFERTTIGVVAVGSWEPPNSQLQKLFTPAEQTSMRDRGVRAEVCGVLLDGEGRSILPEISSRTIAIGGDQLRTIPNVVAVAGGLSKVNAIHSVLVGRYATSLVTDLDVARVLLRR
jgi:DNA-binding transcriptional regulator LsrR (DeoR family)